MTENLRDRIIAGREARLAPLEKMKSDLMAHIDEHFAVLHARLDKLDEGS